MSSAKADDVFRIHASGQLCPDHADHKYISSANRIQEIAQSCGLKSVNLTISVVLNISVFDEQIAVRLLTFAGSAAKTDPDTPPCTIQAMVS
jgi:hypothetical protein